MSGDPGEGVLGAAAAARWLRAMAAAVTAEQDWLTGLDAAIGDGDHGVNLRRGFDAVVARLDELGPAGGGPGPVLAGAGRTLISTVGGASGPLYGSAFRAAGSALGGAPAADLAEVAAAVEAGLAAVQRLGGAVLGDKTMVDAWLPAAEAMRAAVPEGRLGPALAAAAAAAQEGAKATVPLQAGKGRASYLGERSVGHEDPGAASTALLFEALAEAVEP